MAGTISDVRVKLKGCNINQVLHASKDKNDNFSVCLFTANLSGQKNCFPPDIQQYGACVLFKVRSQHVPVNMKGKIGFELEGHWETDRFSKEDEKGKIFVAEGAYEELPDSKAGIVRFLTVAGKRRSLQAAATKIVDMFGKSSIEICANQPERIREAVTLTDDVVDAISSHCKSLLARLDVQKLLRKIKVKPDVITKIVDAYREEAADILRNDPYRLVSLLGFQITDYIALELGESPTSFRRLRAISVEATKLACNKTGCLCADSEKVLAFAEDLAPQVSPERIEEALQKAISDFALIKQGRFLYLKDDFLTDRNIADKVAAFAAGKSEKEAEIEAALLEWQKHNAIQLSPKQLEAVRNLKYRMSIVTGGPGTGKTTCLRAIMDVYHAVWPSENILLMAPTGLAAKRMSESTKMKSTTIHKACGLVPSNNSSGFTATGSCTISGFVGIDEMSMVGEHLFDFALNSIVNSNSTRIVLLGDVDQLAPVSKGDVLRDLIQCGVVKTVFLDVNYRQGNTSTITDASVKIREGNAYIGSQRKLKFDDEFSFFGITNPNDEKAEADAILKKVVEEYVSGVKQYGEKGTIVLTPTHYDKGTPSGYLSKDRINKEIQAVVNPPSDAVPSVEIGRHLFAKGDRVIQRRNTEQVINGDLGTITDIRQTDDDVVVSICFDSLGATIDYDSTQMKDVELAYAITVHSSQGCEFPCCILPVSQTFGVMLTRPLYYTAITRAKKRMVIVGDEEAFKKALANKRRSFRKSLLGPRIITKFQKL